MRGDTRGRLASSRCKLHLWAADELATPVCRVVQVSIFTCTLFYGAPQTLYLQAPQTMSGPSLPHICLLCMSAARYSLLEPALMSSALPPVAFQTALPAQILCEQLLWTGDANSGRHVSHYAASALGCSV